MKMLLGRKIGMTRVFDDRGASHAVTVVQAGPCVVTQIKLAERDGYTAIQLGYGTRRRVTKALAGHLKASNLTPAVLREMRLTDADEAANYTVGQQMDVSIFAPGDMVTVAGTSKGKGFSGVVKRHGFAGGPGSHGSDFHRTAGAIGSRWPQRVVKGRRMAGHMGAERVTVQGLEILQIDPGAQLIAIKGAIPGPRRTIIEIRG